MGYSSFSSHAGQPRQHLGVLAVALAIVLINGAHLARIGHQHAVPQFLEQPADPWTVCSGLHHDQRSRMAATQRGEAAPGVDDALLLEDVALRSQNAYGVLAITKVDSNRDGG